MINNTVPFKINSVLCCIAGIACFNGALLVTIAVLVLHVYLCIPQALTEHCKRALRVEQGREPQRQARRLELRQLQLRPHRRVRTQHVVDRHSVLHELAEARLVADPARALLVRTQQPVRHHRLERALRADRGVETCEPKTSYDF